MKNKYIKFFISSLMVFLFIETLAKDIILSSQRQKKGVILGMPVSGFCSNGFEDFDKTIIQFLTSRGFDCATLAIIKDGKFLVKRGYGWSDKNKTKLTLPDDYLRIASLTKIFTAIAIKKLVENNKLSYQANIMPFLDNFKTIGDPTINKVTILHLLLHQGGWSTDQSLDPFFSLGMITNKLPKEVSNLNSNDIIKYALENIKLDFLPGENTKYSNLGFSLLGRIIEKVAKTSYLNFVNNIICKPERVAVELGPAKLSDKSASEIDYYKSHDINLDNNSISLKAADSTFGLITSAPNLGKILDTYWIDGDTRTTNEKRQLMKTGTLPGSMALARQRYSGASIVILINSRDNNNPEMDNQALSQLIDNTANKCGI